MGNGERRRTYVFYGPPDFWATWQDFKEILKRDGKNMSQELRIYIKDYVARKGGNDPQRPITAYSPENPDEEALLRTYLFKKYLARAKLTEGDVLHRHILHDLKARGVPPLSRVSITRALAKDLKEQGVKVIY